MKFKVDENLPVEIVQMLRANRHDAETIHDERLGGADDPRIAARCRREGRVLITLDLDFADIRAYPPHRYPGFLVLPLRRQDKPAVLSAFRRVLPELARRTVIHRLWIIEETRVRIRGGA